MTRYCHYCGHGPIDADGKHITCSDCHADYYLGKVILRPNITDEEADLLFTKKELTDRQRYGSNKKRKK